ncbi:unnamed protein product [Sphagnum balticum]
MEAREAPDIWRSFAVIERNRESVCKKKPAAIRSQRSAGTGIPKMSIFSKEDKSLERDVLQSWSVLLLHLCVKEKCLREIESSRNCRNKGIATTDLIEN